MIDHKHYSYRVFWSSEDESYIGLCAEFPGVFHIDENPHNAIDGIIVLVGELVQILITDGDPIPEPLADRTYSGRFQVRVPPDVHRNLVMQAAEQGISLNRHVSSKLS